MKSFISDKLNYYLKSSEFFFENNFKDRINFLKKKTYLFNEISNFLNNCIDNTKEIYFFCAGNSIITKNIKSEKIYIKEICNKYKINNDINVVYKDQIDEKDVLKCDTIVIADIEHQANPAINLLKLSETINDNTKIIILSKNSMWMIILKILKYFSNFTPLKNNFLPQEYLDNLISSCNLEIIRHEKIIALPLNIPFITTFLNRLFRLPILSFFCMLNIVILKRVNLKNKKINNLKISYIIPCKNEENNIKLFRNKILKSNLNTEFIFGNDNSSDKTENEIDELIKEDDSKKIIKYNGPGICKSENVYQGIDKSNGDIIVIYDADLTVSFEDIDHCLYVLTNTNTDFINCTRMIYPQKHGAMKTLNFIGNIFFAKLFSILFKKTITDTLCGTKIFYKKDWGKIKKDVSSWGAKDLWGDFDLLIGAFKNNLKITEVPITYHDRKGNETKMNSLFSNGIRMFLIVIFAYYKLRLKK